MREAIPLVLAFAFMCSFAWLVCLRVEDWNTGRWPQITRVFPVLFIQALCIVVGGMLGPLPTTEGKTWFGIMLLAGFATGLLTYWLRRRL